MLQEEIGLIQDVQTWYLYNLSVTISTNSSEHLLCPALCYVLSK